MKKTKIIFSVFMLFFSMNNCFGQNKEIVNEIRIFPTEFFNFLKNFNNEIDSFFKKEEAEKVWRNLQYFKNDLNNYLIERKKLMDYLDKNNYAIENETAKEIVIELKIKLDNLTNRFSSFRPFVSAKLSSEMSFLLTQVYGVQLSQRRDFLSELDRLIAGKKINIENLKDNGEEIYNKLLESVELITKIQSKLNEKFNLK